MLFVVCCMFFVLRCLQFVVVDCSLFVFCSLLFDVCVSCRFWCLLFAGIVVGGRCMAFVRC